MAFSQKIDISDILKNGILSFTVALLCEVTEFPWGFYEETSKSRL